MIQNCNKKNNPQIEILSDFLKIISEENRLRIICFLLKNEEQCVCEIWKFLDLSQNLTSHHLKVLKDIGLLESRKVGQKVCYCVDQTKLLEYKELFNQILDKTIISRK